MVCRRATQNPIFRVGAAAGRGFRAFFGSGGPCGPYIPLYLNFIFLGELGWHTGTAAFYPMFSGPYAVPPPGTPPAHPRHTPGTPPQNPENREKSPTARPLRAENRYVGSGYPKNSGEPGLSAPPGRPTPHRRDPSDPHTGTPSHAPPTTHGTTDTPHTRHTGHTGTPTPPPPRAQAHPHTGHTHTPRPPLMMATHRHPHTQAHPHTHAPALWNRITPHGTPPPL